MSTSKALATIEKPGPLSVALAGYDPGRYNLATPITVLDQVPPMHRVSIRVVQIDPESETYPIPGSDKVGLGKSALDKIAAAAGITWIPERSGQVDNWNNPHRVKYRAVCTIQDFDGRRRTVFAEKEVDLRGEPGWEEGTLGSDAREFVRVAAKRSRDPWPQIYQQRQHIHSMAESKAKLRCIRAAIGLPVSMPKAQAARPFVVPALVPDLDTADPEIRRMMAASLIGSQAALYGPPEASVRTAAPEPEPIDLSDAEDVSGEWEELPASAAPRTTDGGDPWDTAEASSPLPLSDEVLATVPVGQSVRMTYLTRINALYADLALKVGDGQAAAFAAKLCEGVDLITASMDDLARIGRAISAEARGQ